MQSGVSAALMFFAGYSFRLRNRLKCFIIFFYAFILFCLIHDHDVSLSDARFELASLIAAARRLLIRLIYYGIAPDFAIKK